MEHSLNIKKTDGGNEGVLSLEGDMTLTDALEIKDVLLEAIDKVGTLHLEIKQAESVDISFLQLVCAAHRECFLSGKKILLQDNPGGDLKKIISKAGYSKTLGCPKDAKHTCLLSEMN